MLEIIDGSRAGDSLKLAFRFMVLTAARSGEVALAEWEDVDMTAKVWSRPAAKMKTGVAHRQPLIGAAMTILESARGLSGGQGYIFPGRTRGFPISTAAFRDLMQAQGMKPPPTDLGRHSGLGLGRRRLPPRRSPRAAWPIPTAIW